MALTAYSEATREVLRKILADMPPFDEDPTPKDGDYVGEGGVFWRKCPERDYCGVYLQDRWNLLNPEDLSTILWAEKNKAVGRISPTLEAVEGGVSIVCLIKCANPWCQARRGKPSNHFDTFQSYSVWKGVAEWMGVVPPGVGKVQLLME